MAATARPTVGVLSLVAIGAVPEPAVARDASIWEALRTPGAVEPALPVPGHRPPGLRPGSSLGSTRRIAPG
jgi:hypothetical protein